jgi:hypothetical protein
MRIMLIASAILAASVSTALAQSTTAAPAQQPAPAAAAQQWSLDHGRAEDAANAAKSAAIGAAIKEIVAAAKAQAAAPADSDSSSDFVAGGSGVIAPELPRTTEQQRADTLAEAAWQTRCRPAVVEDREGIRRVKYAESDCDLTRYNTAGR